LKLFKFFKKKKENNIWWSRVVYYKKNHHLLRRKFRLSKSIISNFSQCHQDLFFLMMSDGKKNGTYLEIGSNDPFESNNTAILEGLFSYKGLSIDILKSQCMNFANKRVNPIINANALKLNYKTLFKKFNFFKKNIDYLSIDYEPASTTFSVLKKIIKSGYKFSVITFEHDYYNAKNQIDKNILEESRAFLKKNGYLLIVNNISVDAYHPHEDWYAHPDLIKKKIIKNMISINNLTKKSEDYIFGKI
jgi:hypothetical protein